METHYNLLLIIRWGQIYLAVNSQPPSPQWSFHCQTEMSKVSPSPTFLLADNYTRPLLRTLYVVGQYGPLILWIWRGTLLHIGLASDVGPGFLVSGRVTVFLSQTLIIVKLYLFAVCFFYTFTFLLIHPLFLCLRWSASLVSCFCGRLRFMIRRRECMRWGRIMRLWSSTCCQNMWLNTFWAQRNEMRYKTADHTPYRPRP